MIQKEEFMANIALKGGVLGLKKGVEKMAAQKAGYEDFIAAVSDKDKEFVNEVNACMLENGCKLEVKPAKAGYVAAYKFLKTKKSIANFVFRKKGLMIRIYGDGIKAYEHIMDELNDGMAAEVKKASPCKRLLDAAACSDKCVMGYDFMLKGERQQKCRYSGLMFTVCEQNNPHIMAIVRGELEQRNLS